MQHPHDRLLNVSLLAGSPAHRAYRARVGSGPRASLNLHFFGGKTIADLVFVNHYLGGSRAWAAADTASIDAALAKTMTDNDLQSVLQQYYGPAISSRMLPSAVLPGPAPAVLYKDQVEALAGRIHGSGALAGADLGRTVVNIMLPRGVILVDGFSPGFQPPPGTEAEHERRLRAVVRVGGKDADSRHGLGGYHGSSSTTRSGCTPKPGTAFPSSTSPGRTWPRRFTTSSTRPGPTRTWTTPSGPATAPASAGTAPGAERSAISRSPGPTSPWSSPRSSWPTARAPSRSS
jgi:hypothetical protein